MCTLPKEGILWIRRVWRTETGACFRYKYATISAEVKIEMGVFSNSAMGLKTACNSFEFNAASEAGSGYQITGYPVVTLLVKLTGITFNFSVSAAYSGNDTCCCGPLGLIFAL